MKRHIIAAIAVSLLACGARAQTVNRPVSSAITNAVLAVTGVTSNAAPTTLGQDFGKALADVYTYVNTNGAVSAGFGNTLRTIGEAKFEALMTESVALPQIVPSNGVCNVGFELVASQLYAPDKTHTGLGLGLNLLWHTGWMDKLNLGPLSTLQGIKTSAFIAPDIDQTANLRFSQNTTVAGIDAGLYFKF
jgi:hypothetical protein